MGTVTLLAPPEDGESGVEGGNVEEGVEDGHGCVAMVSGGLGAALAGLEAAMGPSASSYAGRAGAVAGKAPRAEKGRRFTLDSFLSGLERPAT